MRKDYRCYRENFPYVLDVQHKVTPYTEKMNFHLHNQMEIIYSLSDNLIFKSENSTFSVPAHSLLVARTCAYIDQHFQESLSVETVAQEFCVSKTQMYNLFREVLRMSVSDYLLHVRMSQAKSLLINTDYSVEIISQKVGYGNISSFSRTFKSQVDMTPLQYRKIQRETFSA